ncbi:bifunctional phosphopantothenoylcysteine decarboxylase/phosphopantothenate--cysteine ligase CoaBC [Corynebacterium atypicum]|uniref:bifunctional phosphopantothenoylcysteine decarboxylase/phosphopantothenate--cysteine ligase CoaBC n=1 Tax=Corynebacterium atypicum TaxID=191610 RepID=UPI000AE9AAB7|nr:bifunctional phosphopantothenoylcysteine decarboxylase/phosphopantothenate--cysteine ligase CoaBC [Corynebacterium atypicum]
MTIDSSAAPRAPKVLLGVAGGIAAFKACTVVRELARAQADVTVVPTANALRFVGAATFEALSGNPVATDVFTGVDEVRHVRLGQEADLVLIAPATADLLARLAAGRADDLLSASVLVATCPVVVAPAMHTEMWLNPATRENVATLRRRGIVVLEPATGRLTGPDSGPGRMLEPQQIVDLARLVLGRGRLSFSAEPQPLAGKRVLITAGGTREPLDPVRFLGNRSSGRQGFALAEVSGQLGAQVELIAAATAELPVPAATSVTRVETTAQLAEEVNARAASSDLIVMSAAVSDYRPLAAKETKMKKGVADAELEHLRLTENPDILRGLVRRRAEGAIPAGTTIVGFAAETGDAAGSALDYGKKKLVKKGCDVLMCNEVGGGKAFGTPVNAGWVLSRPRGGAAQGPGVGGQSLQSAGDVRVEEIAEASKLEVAWRILRAAAQFADAAQLQT